MPKSAKPAKPAKKRSAASRSKAAQARNAAPPKAPPPVEHPTAELESVYTETMIESGQAACLDEDGKLPRGATHKIVEDENGGVKVVRRRFSIT